MTDCINIHDPIADICSRLGLAPDLVGELKITPSVAVATVYRLRDGSKHVDDDGEVATDTLTFKVIA